MRRLLRFLAVLLLGVRAVAGAATAVVSAGDNSPLGLPFSSFSSVALDESGNLIFLGASTGGFRADVGGAVVRVVAAGDVLPSGDRVAGVGPPAAGPGGCTALRAILIGGGDAVLRRCGAAPTQTVVTSGTSVPGLGTIVALSPAVAYGAGDQIAYTALLDDGSTALLRAPGNVPIVRSNDTSPAGGRFTTVRLVGVSASGRVGFRAGVSNGPDGLFAGDGMTLTKVVTVGEASPAGGSFTAIGNATLSDTDRWAFRATISGPSGTQTAVFRADATAPATVQMEVVVREGDPTSPAGVVIRQLPSSLAPSINASGAVVFRAALGGRESGSAVFLAVPGNGPARLVSTRDPTAVGSLVRFRDPVLANDGSVVIQASITGSGPGLFIYRGGVVSVLARLGDATDIDTGQERFRFSTPSASGAAEQAVFLGSREGIFVSEGGTVRTVAFVGGPTPLRGVFASLDAPAADATGVVAFGGEIKGGRASRALFATDRRGHTRVVAAATDRIGHGRFVDFFAGTIDALARPDVGSKGIVAFEATLQGSKTPRAIFLRSGARPLMIAGAHKKAPGGGTYESFGTPALLRDRQVAFVAQVAQEDGPTNEALFVRRGGGTRLMARAGSGSAGRLPGRFDSFDPPDADATTVVCRATLVEGGREGIFIADAKHFGLLVGSGDTSPTGQTFRSFGRPLIGANGVVFPARLNGTSQPVGLFRAPGARSPSPDAVPALEIMALPGDPSPLGGTILEFGAVDGNRAGAIAAAVELAGASARAAVIIY